MRLPKPAECERLYEQYRLPANVRQHIEKVTAVAVFTAKALKMRGIAIDVGLVQAAARLHDLARPADFSSLFDSDGNSVAEWEELRKIPGNHAEVAYQLLRDKFPDVAMVIRKHFYRAVVTAGLEPRTWEEKVLTYADKRVCHDRIVSLEERFMEGNARWLSRHPGQDMDQIENEKIQSAYHGIEREIFKILGPALQEKLKNGKGLL